MIFLDETYVVNDPMWKQWITLHKDEAPEAYALMKRRPQGWMFWGQFAGHRKGATHFWEKGLGGIDSDKYIDKILPLVEGFYNTLPSQERIFQQDNASSHSSRRTRQELLQRHIQTVVWPAKSPNLNPIENV